MQSHTTNGEAINTTDASKAVRAGLEFEIGGVWGVFWVLLGAAIFTSGRGIAGNSATASRGPRTYGERRVTSHPAG